MMAITSRDVEGVTWLLVAVLVLVFACCLAWLATNPEPCMDPNTTACAVPYRDER